MNSAICTLFEGHYHYGVAALTNSLYTQGFRGSIYAGYKGELPTWAAKAYENKKLHWPRAKTLAIAENLELHFLPLDTDYHLTNYKPDFMLRLWEGLAKNAEAMFYADPDLVVNAPWSYFEKWVQGGVSVCEDINSPLPEFHPRRMEWRSFFQEKGVNLIFKEPYYANGGFVGVNLSNRCFLESWKVIQEKVGELIGGLDKSSLKGKPLPNEQASFFAPFSKTDQDALNCTIEETHCTVAFLGKDAMGFSPGLVCLPHALGTPKPWDWPVLKQSIKGIPPSQQMKAYWQFASGPFKCYSPLKLQIKFLEIKFAAFLGRFYSRR